MQQRTGIQDRDQAVAGVGAAALHHLGVDGGDRAVLLHTDLEPNPARRPAPVGEEDLLAREFELDRAAGSARQRRGHHFEVQRLDAVAETAADERLDDADRRAVQAEGLRQREVQVVGHLGHRMDRQTRGLDIPLRDRGVQFELAMRDFGAIELAFEHHIGGGEAGCDIAEVLLDPALQVAGLVVVQQHGIGRTRGGGVEVGRQGLDLDHHGGQRCRRAALIVGRHREQRLAAVAHLVAGQRPFVLRDRDHAVGRREILAGDDGAHARQGQRGRSVDAADQAMRHRAAADAADERIGKWQVGGVARAAADFLDPVDQRLAHADRVRGRRALAQRQALGLHRRAPAAACTASTIFT